MPEGGFLVKLVLSLPKGLTVKKRFAVIKFLLNTAILLISVTMKNLRSCQEKASAGLRLSWSKSCHYFIFFTLTDFFLEVEYN